MVVSQFQIGTVPESHCLKFSKFCTGLSSHRSCSPILSYNVIALSSVILLSHMLYSAFAALNIFFTTGADFEDHIKSGRLQFAERKRKPLNVNVNR